MIRLFAGLRPPPQVRAGLRAAMGGVATARWQNDLQLHLTLRFIGDVDRHVLADVEAGLATVRAAPFLLRTDRTGTFEHRGRLQALWVGVRPVEPVEQLHKSVNRALQHVGITSEHRAFLPHVTLARFGRGAPERAMEAAACISVPPLEWAVDHFCLFESILTPEGSVYHLIERYPLQG